MGAEHWCGKEIFHTCARGKCSKRFIHSQCKELSHFTQVSWIDESVSQSVSQSVSRRWMDGSFDQRKRKGEEKERRGRGEGEKRRGKESKEGRGKVRIEREKGETRGREKGEEGKEGKEEGVERAGEWMGRGEGERKREREIVGRQTFTAGKIQKQGGSPRYELSSLVPHSPTGICDLAIINAG